MHETAPLETWAAVVRTSHMGKRKADADDFHADAEQVAEIHRYAAGRANVVFLPPELDVKGNAPIEERPSLRAAIEGVERGDYDGIVVAYLKRLTRSRSGHLIWERVETAGGRVHCARERLDTSTATGRRMRDYAIADAVAEREEHAEQHALRRQSTVERGIWRQRQTPLGYRRGEKPNRHLIPDERADDVRAAFRAAIAGVPLVRIAADLGMSPSGARKLLTNRVYLGELRDGGRAQRDGSISPLHVNADAHEPLIDADTFDAAQAAIARNPRPPRRAAGVALLAGLVRCASCGHVMSRKSSGGVTYSCAPHKSAGRCPAPAGIAEARLDEHVEAIALARLARLHVEAAERGDGVERARRELADAEAELSAYVSAVSAAVVGAAVFAEGARVRREAVDAARERLRQELARAPAVLKYPTTREAWEELSVAEHNELLRSLLACVIVAPAGRGRRVPVGERVRVLRHGAKLALPRGVGGQPAPIVALGLPGADDEAVLGMPSPEDAL